MDAAAESDRTRSDSCAWGRLRPITSSSFSKAMNCAMANFPTGNDEMRAQRSISSFIQMNNFGSRPARERDRRRPRVLPGNSGRPRRNKFGARTSVSVMPQNSLNQPKQSASRRPRERPAQNRFFHAGRLTNQHDLAENCAAGNGWRHHPRTAATLEQTRDVLIELALSARNRRASSGIRLSTEESEKIRLSTMLMMMQVTIGKVEARSCRARCGCRRANARATRCRRRSTERADQ